MKPAFQKVFYEPNNLGMVWYLIDGAKVQLTPTQRELFALFYNARGGWVLMEEIWDNVAGWGFNSPSRQNLGVQLHHLRQKLFPTRFRIVNKYEFGFKMYRVKQ